METTELPIYKANLQDFYRYPIAKVEHNGFGTAIKEENGFVMGFIETIGLRVVKLRENNGVFWIWAKADKRYCQTSKLMEVGKLVQPKKEKPNA